MAKKKVPQERDLWDVNNEEPEGGTQCSMKPDGFTEPKTESPTKIGKPD